MDWLRSHPYLAALAGAGVLIVLGVFVVGQRSAVAPENSATQAWGGVGTGLVNPTPSGPALNASADQQNLYAQVQSGPPFYYSTVPPAQSTGNTSVSGTDQFDFNAFLATLVAPKGTSATSDADQLLKDVYSFIPGGLISTSTSQKTLTPSQQALYAYGNEAGASIQAFENNYRNMTQIMKNQQEDPTDPEKVAAFNGLANAMTQLGLDLEEIASVPPIMAAANMALAKAYQDMGAKFLLVAKAQRSEDRIQAMLTYDAAVEVWVKKYVAVVTLFSASGVSFAPGDPGSVFMFTQASF